MLCHSQSIETRFHILDYLYLPLLPFDILCTQPYPSPLDAGLCNLLDCQLNCQPRNSPIENTGTHTWLSIEQTPARLGPSMSIDLVHNDHKNRRDDQYTDQTNERVSKIEPIIVLERCQQVATLRSKDQVAWVHISTSSVCSITTPPSPLNVHDALTVLFPMVIPPVWVSVALALHDVTLRQGVPAYRRTVLFRQPEWTHMGLSSTMS